MSPDLQAMTELLERAGLHPDEARARAEQALRGLSEVRPGTIYGGLHAEDLPRLWSDAARSGARRLVLEISAEADAQDEDSGHLRVRVRAREDWPEREAAPCGPDDPCLFRPTVPGEVCGRPGCRGAAGEPDRTPATWAADLKGTP